MKIRRHFTLSAASVDKLEALKRHRIRDASFLMNEAIALLFADAGLPDPAKPTTKRAAANGRGKRA